jgi:hypothetical protein
MSVWQDIPHITPFKIRPLSRVTHYHRFIDPGCVEHLEFGRVYLWVVRKGTMYVCMRHHRKFGTKHTDLSKLQKCQAGGEIKVTEEKVYINVKSGSFRKQDLDTKFIMKEYLEGQPKPVKLLKCVAMREG